MMKCELTQPRTLRLPVAATSTLTFVFAMLLVGQANAQGWPFNDAPEPVGFGVLQTSNDAAIGDPAHPTSGVIMSADALDLGPGEKVIGGDPVLHESGILQQPGGFQQPGMVSQPGHAKGGIPYRPLHHSGRGPQRRPRGESRFGPVHRYDSSRCPEGCAPALYGNFEALYIDQNQDAFNYSRNLFGFVEDDYELGVRVTLGRMCNCSDGYEATFTGLLEWERSGTRLDPTGQLNFRPLAVNPFDEANLPGLYDTSVQVQRFRARYNSLEFNHREWGWDVISTVAGVRVINYEEEFDFASRSLGGDIGQFHQNVDNIMIGAQLGLDLMYPVMRRMMIGSRIRGGLYANVVESDTFLADSSQANPVLIRHSYDDVDYAGLFESGVSVNYHFLPGLSAKVGYEFWYMMHVSTIAAERTATISPDYGARGGTDDIGFHGATASIELLF